MSSTLRRYQVTNICKTLLIFVNLFVLFFVLRVSVLRVKKIKCISDALLTQMQQAARSTHRWTGPLPAFFHAHRQTRERHLGTHQVCYYR